MSNAALSGAALEVDARGPLKHSDIPVLTLATDGGAALRARIRSGKPAIVSDFAADWPALQRWSPEQLSARVGERMVNVYDASFGAPGRNYMSNVDAMTFARFLEEVLEEGRDLRMFLYNISRQVPELLDDIRFPPLGLKFSRRFVFTFFGCAGSTTPLHYDIDMGEVFHTVVRGRRRIRLFAPDQSRQLYQHPFTVRSYVDLDKPDFDEFPALPRAHGHELVLEPGQTLYMPSGWWHEFHYLESGIGISLRAPAERLRQRMEGLINLLVLSPVDRVANRLAGQRWYAWKQKHSRRRAGHRNETRLT